MDEERQATFGPDGELETEAPEATGTNDFGEETGADETDGGFNRYAVVSLLQKAIRRGDEEVAAWCAWELARSGFGWNLWDRLQTFVVEDLAADTRAPSLVARYEDLAERWDMDSRRGQMAAVQAALAVARARSAREGANAVNAFHAVAKRRAEARERGEEPTHTFPVTAADLSADGEYDVALDGHTGEGARLNRGSPFFRIHGARVGPEGETDVSARWKRLFLALDEYDYTDERVAHALSAVDPADRWSEPSFDDG
ncbi:hypothetical protein EI982_14970 [Haloplanus rallus]|uniref:Uncharacterized protein n=1 Tax=Haloplanus rallus TaxID=1816183 RepID=A0A6B9FC09_9EURY|nr:hypothetical protein [Haloplanus rallus]QGX95991.1 hypothetical protein EI982_14970 [Haloplanus rallus]